MLSQNQLRTVLASTVVTCCRVLMRAYNLAAEIMRSELDEGHH